MPAIPISIFLLFPSSLFILIISIFLFAKRKDTPTLIFLFVGILQFFWMLSVLALWQVYIFGFVLIKTNLTAQLLSLSVFLIPTILYHFSVEFCQIRKQKFWLYFIYVVSIGFILTNDTNAIFKQIFSLQVPEFNNWLTYGFAIFVIALLFLTMFNFTRALLFKEPTQERRKDILTFIILTFGIYGLIFLYFLPETLNSIIPIFFMIIPIYALIFVYVAIEKNPFATTLTADIIVSAVLILLASFIIFPNLELGLIAKLVIFVLIAVICFLLLRYANRLYEQKNEFREMLENRTRELQENTWRLHEMNDQLEESNTVLEIKVKARTRALKELNDSLEHQVKERTKELENKTKELEEKIKELKEFSNIFINRENKMAELKQTIKELQGKINELEDAKK